MTQPATQQRHRRRRRIRTRRAALECLHDLFFVLEGQRVPRKLALVLLDGRRDARRGSDIAPNESETMPSKTRFFCFSRRGVFFWTIVFLVTRSVALAKASNQTIALCSRKKQDDQAALLHDGRRCRGSLPSCSRDRLPSHKRLRRGRVKGENHSMISLSSTLSVHTSSPHFDPDLLSLSSSAASATNKRNNTTGYPPQARPLGRRR